VIGAGAVGSVLGALLHRAGQKVVIIARPAHVAAIRQNGLQVDGDVGNFITSIEAAQVERTGEFLSAEEIAQALMQ